MVSEMSAVKCCILVMIFIGIVYCLKVVPERATILFVDKDNIDHAKIYVSRHGRKSGYYLNMEANILKPWYNNVTIHLIFFEYLHNEYRRSFVEMHFKLCDFLNEAFVGGMFKKLGVACPVFGEYHLINMSLPTENFRYVVPFEKTRVDVYANMTATNAMLYLAQVQCQFKK